MGEKLKMLHLFRFPTLLALAAALIALGILSFGGAGAAGPPDGNGPDHAIAVQDAHTDRLLAKPGVVGTAVGLNANGQPVIVIYTESAGVAGLPSSLDGIPVAVRVTGRFFAFAPPPLDANFTSSCSDLTCDFDASSTTGKGKKSYSWDFDASGGIGTDATGQQVTHTYSLDGDYTVTLTVTSNEGTSTIDKVVTVYDGGGLTDCGATGDTTVKCARPVPIGVSTGHPDITAGTIGARVAGLDNDDNPAVFALSNNHIYANQNGANIGDDVIQPGTFDGGSLSDDKIGTLHDYEPIVFTDTADNTMDAAIALSSTTDLGNATPSDGYGTPSSSIVSASPDLAVQKYGRTTNHTFGTVSEINVTVLICYEGFPFCTKIARFVEQFAITDGDFSAGGDSGSLVVTSDANKKPVGLVFAGSSTRTIANDIGNVLARFGVTVDGPATTGGGGGGGGGGALTVEVTTDKATSYVNKEKVHITATVKAGTNPVEGATVDIIIDTPKFRLACNGLTTNAAGEAFCDHKVNTRRDGTGSYTITANASKAGFTSGTASTTIPVE